jgi:hypothetical protein
VAGRSTRSLGVILENAIVVSIVTIVVIDLWATATVVRSDMFAPLQKLMQIVLVWLVPLLGAYLVFGIARPPETEKFEIDLATRTGPEGDIGIQSLPDHSGVDGH